MFEKDIRVLIVDDHDVVLRGIEACLLAFDDILLVGKARNGFEALRACADTRPHVILMDIVMPVMDGIEATKRIRREFPDVHVIALTSYKDNEKVQGMLRAGALGYLLKDAPVDDLDHIIKSVMDGKTTLAREVTATMLPQSPPTPRYDLSEREIEVLQLLVKGHNNRAIAEKLSVSRGTVKYYVSSILTKFGVNNRTEAVALVLQNRILPEVP